MENFVSKISKEQRDVLKEYGRSKLLVTISGINATGRPFEVQGIINVEQGVPTVNSRLIALDFGEVKNPYFFGYFTSELNVLTITDELHRVLYENPDAEKVKEAARQFKEYSDQEFAKTKLEKISQPYIYQQENEKVLQKNIGRPVDIVADGATLHTVVYDYFNLPPLNCCVATIELSGSQKIIGIVGDARVEPMEYQNYIQDQTGGKRLC